MRFGATCDHPHCVRCRGVWDPGWVPRPDGMSSVRGKFKQPKQGPWWWPFPLFKAVSS